jgi:tetratricopeptide (TPR) repeat protein
VTALSPANEVLRRALALADSKSEEARTALAAGLVEARRSGDKQGIVALARHAALLCERANELVEALTYYDEALQHEPNDAYLHYGAGNVRRTLGQRDSARAAFLNSLELGRQQADDDIIGIASSALAALDKATGEL